MGILVKQPVLVVQCGHNPNATAFWTTKNEGSEPPDLWFQNFPDTGRMFLTNQVIYVACLMCEHGLDAVVNDSIKARSI